MRLSKQLTFALTITFAVFCTTGCSDSTGPEEPELIEFNSKAAPGDSAKSYLEGDQYTRLQVEIDYMPGHEPTQNGLDSLKTFLQRRLNKNSISFQESEISSGNQNSYTSDDIRSLEDEHRDNRTEPGSNTLHVYFLVVDGEYEQSNVLGIAYWNTSVAFFGETIERASGMPPAAPSKEKIEATVFRHEFGHNMGLVGIGTPTQSDHKTSGSAHCTESGCLMEPAVETTDFFSNFSGSIPPLKQFCIEDLQANGGK
jgi:hypothetical protein